MSHPADSVVSVLNKEKGSTATQVLKKLGPKGTSCLFMKISVHCASVFHNTLLRSTSGEFLRFCRVLSLGAAASGRRLPAALRLFSWRCLSHWRVRSVYLLTQNPLCPDPTQESARAEQLESGQTIIRVDHSKCPEWIGKWTVLCFSGVWKGLVARIIMIGTLTALQWFIYDSVKVYFRLPRPPPPEMPESLKKKLGLTE